MKKKVSAALLAAALCLGMLAGCSDAPTGNGGNVTPTPPPTPGGTSTQPTPPVMTPSTELSEPPQPDQILSDVGVFRYTVLPEGATVTGCEVIKRQSNPENKEDIVYCRLTGPENGYKYAQYYVRLLYNFYDEGGWILDKMTADQVDRWGTIGYLDSEGRPIEEGMVLIGPAVDFGNRNPSAGSPVEPMPIPDDPDATPPTGADRPSARSYPTAINNEGMWDYQGKVYDFSGNEVSGLVQNTSANRAIWWEDRQLYLCDLNGNRLSAGYDSIQYGGRVLDDNGIVVDHRWQIQRGNKLGFLNDAGEEVIPLIYNDSDYAYPRFCTETFGGGSAYKVCEFHDDATDTNIVVDVNGRELLRTSDTVCVYGNGFYTRRLTDGSGGYYCIGYKADGTQLFSGTYYEILASDAGFCGWVGFDQNHAWDLYAWDGSWSQELWDGDEHLSLLYMLPNSYCYGDYDNNRCVMRCSGATITTNQIVAYVNNWIINSAYGALNCSTYVMDMDGNWILSPADLDEEVHYSAVAGGIYAATGIYSGTAALFDWKGNQRTEYFDGIVARSENGRYFIVVKDGQYYAMRSPIGEEELQTAPAFNFSA